jgi:hypothetical protein
MRDHSRRMIADEHERHISSDSRQNAVGKGRILLCSAVQPFGMSLLYAKVARLPRITSSCAAGTLLAIATPDSKDRGANETDGAGFDCAPFPSGDNASCPVISRTI